MLDPVAQTLNAFDLIVLANVDTSRLDSAQLTALQAYVRNGGSVLVVGGPDWQETLRPLPVALLPGTLTGTRILPDLHGLQPLSETAWSAGHAATAVSLLTHPTGTVPASQAGVPLIVRRVVGSGTVEYLAFDPAGSSLPPKSPILQHVITMV